MSNYINQQIESNGLVDAPGYILGANYYPSYNPNDAKFLRQVNNCITPYKTPQEIDKCVLAIHAKDNQTVATKFATIGSNDPRYNPNELYVGNIKGLSDTLCLNKTDPRSLRECLSNVGLGVRVPISIRTPTNYRQPNTRGLPPDYSYGSLSQQYESSRDTL